MGEIRSEKVEVVKTALYCDNIDCGGEMIPDGSMLTMNPPLYPHFCEKCGYRENSHDIYPTISYLEIK